MSLCHGSGCCHALMRYVAPCNGQRRNNNDILSHKGGKMYGHATTNYIDRAGAWAGEGGGCVIHAGSVWGSSDVRDSCGRPISVSDGQR